MFIARVTNKCAEPQRGKMSAAKHATPTELKTRLRHADYKHSTPNGVISLATQALKRAFESYPHFLKSYFEAHAKRREVVAIAVAVKRLPLLLPLAEKLLKCCRKYLAKKLVLERFYRVLHDFTTQTLK